MSVCLPSVCLSLIHPVTACLSHTHTIEKIGFEPNVETDNELRVYGGREFQSLGAKALLPRDVRTYGMDRTNESDDLVDRE